MEPRNRDGMFFAVFFILLFAAEASLVSRSDWFSKPPKPVGDGLQYENIGFHLWLGKGFYFDNTNANWRSIYQAESGIDYSDHLEARNRSLPATDRPPLYPCLIATSYAVCGRSDFGFALVRLASAAFLALSGALSALGVLWLARQLDLRSTASTFIAAIAAGLVVLANRNLQSYANDFLTEPLAMCWLQASVLLFIVGVDREAKAQRIHWRFIFGAGICVAGLVLTRSIFVVWLPWIVMLVFCLPSPQWKTRAKRSLVFLTAVLIVCSPWWIHNIIVLKQFVPLGTQGPIAVLGGYNQVAWNKGGEWDYSAERKLRNEVREKLEVDNKEAGADGNSTLSEELKVMELADRKLKQWIYEHWKDLPQIAVSRVYTHWNPYYGKSLLWKLAVLAGTIGLAVQARKSGQLRAFLILGVGLSVTSTCVAALLYTVGGRFLIPVYGVLNTMFGLAVLFLLASVEGRLPWRPE